MRQVQLAADLRDLARRLRRSWLPGTPAALKAFQELVIRDLEAKADEIDPPRRQKVTTYAVAPARGGRMVMVQHRRGSFGL